jgi:hypothetical protein
VLTSREWNGACEERFAQGRCGSPWCSVAVDKRLFERNKLVFDEATGVLRDVSELGMYCSEACFARTQAFEQCLGMMWCRQWNGTPH